MARRACRWCLGIGTYVAHRGATRVALDLSGAGHPVTRQAVYSWARGQRLPRPSIGRALIETSDGALSFADLYGRRDQDE